MVCLVSGCWKRNGAVMISTHEAQQLFLERNNLREDLTKSNIAVGRLKKRIKKLTQQRDSLKERNELLTETT